MESGAQIGLGLGLRRLLYQEGRQSGVALLKGVISSWKEE